MDEAFRGVEAEETVPQGRDQAARLPSQNARTWALLVLILVAIAVAILYVYQAGDRKTVLGNQPLPSGDALAFGQALPGVGALIPVAPAQPVAPVPRAASSQAVVVRCPGCGTQGVPVCASCGALMRRLDPGAGSALFVCPSCGAAGVPPCPRCRARMVPSRPGVPSPIAFHPGAPRAGGQHHCTACGGTGLPDWQPDGTPLCPGCGTRMTVTVR